MSICRCLAILIVAAGVVSAHALALTDEEVYRDFRFNLINPGGRSLGLGGAFISLADDASAAQANPAGLSYLRKKEFMVELRRIDSGGTGGVIRDDLPAGGSTLVLTGTDLQDITKVSFVSAVFPIGNITLGFSAQVALATENSTLNRFTFAFDTGGGAPSTTSTTQGTGSIDVEQINFNTSLGFRVNDRLAFGASVFVSRLTVMSEVTNLVFDPDDNLGGGAIIEPTLDLRSTIDDDDYNVGFSLGGIYRPSDKFSFGAVYRRAPKLAVTQMIGQGIDIFGVRAQYGDSFSNEFNMPDSYGIGMSVRFVENFTLAFDVERTEYSDLAKGFVPGVNALTGFDAVFVADDVFDYRLGGEYVVFSKGGVPLAFRAGVFTRGDDSLRAVDTGSNSFATADSFPGKDREIRGALGLGVGLGRHQIDLGIGLGDSDNEYVVSYILKIK